MTKEEVIEMARQAGLRVGPSRDGPDDVWGVSSGLERFAKLIRDDYSNKHAALWLKRIDEAVMAEREEIVAEFLKRHEGVSHRNNYWHHAANYVQAKGETKLKGK